MIFNSIFGSDRLRALQSRIADGCRVLAQAWLLVVLLALIAYSVWTLDRGFDLTDESYYLLNAMYPGEIRLFATAAHWVTPWLWDVSGSLVAFRALGLIILLLSAQVLALGVLQAGRICGILTTPVLGQRVAVSAGALIGALLYGSFVNFAPSYNLMATSGSYAAVGMTLLSAHAKSGWRVPALQLLAGGGLAIATLCKFSTGIATLGLVLLLALFFLNTLRARIIGIALIIVGFSAVLGLMVLTHGGLHGATRQFQLGMSIGSLVIDETILLRLERYYDELYLHAYLVGRIFAVPLLCVVLAAILRSTLIALAGIGWLGFEMFSGDYLMGGMSQYHVQTLPLLSLMMLCAIATVPDWSRHWQTRISLTRFLIIPFCIAVGSASLALLTLCLMATAPRWGRNWRVRILFAALFVLPYGIAIGSGNKITTQLLFSLAPWGAVIALMAFSERRSGAINMAAQLACAIFAVLIASQIVTNGLNAPYRLHRPLDQQTEPTSLGALGTVRLDPETAQFVRQIKTIAAQCGIDDGRRHFLGLYNIPGIALLTHTIPAFTSWMFMQKYTEAILDTVPADSYRDAVVGIQLEANDALPPMPRQLAAFPQGYRLCGSAVIPYQQQKVQLWVPEQSHAR